MNIQIFVRNISLTKLGLTELKGREKRIYEFLMENLSGLNTYTSDKKPKMLYFGKSEEDIVLFCNSESETFYVDTDKIWSFFENGLSMDYSDIKSLIIWWVAMTLNLNIDDIIRIVFPSHINMNFNLKPTTLNN